MQFSVLRRQNGCIPNLIPIRDPPSEAQDSILDSYGVRVLAHVPVGRMLARSPAYNAVHPAFSSAAPKARRGLQATGAGQEPDLGACHRGGVKHRVLECPIVVSCF